MVCTTAAVLLCVATPGVGSASLLHHLHHRQHRHHRVELPPQGLYEECAPSTEASTCAQHLEQMSRAGFKLVLNYTQWYSTPEEVVNYASEAESLGMKVIWPLNAPAWRGDSSLIATYPTLAASCACDDNLSFLEYVIGLVKDLPATWGYYIGDELPASQLPQVHALAGELQALDPRHPRLFIASGMGGDPLVRLDPFSGVASVLGSDAYPVGYLKSPSRFVGRVAADDAQVAASHHLRTAVVLQSFSWSQYPSEGRPPLPRWPTAREVLAMRDAAIQQAHPSMILWYSFKDIEDSADPLLHWRDLIAATRALPTSKHRTGRVRRRSGRRHEGTVRARTRRRGDRSGRARTRRHRRH